MKYLGVAGLLCVGLVAGQFLFNAWHGAMEGAIREADAPPEAPRAERPAQRVAEMRRATPQPAQPQASDVQIRIRALRRLVGQPLDSDATAAVVAACGDANGYVREAAMEVAAKAPPSLPLLAALIDGLEDTHGTVRSWAEEGLRSCSTVVPERTLLALVCAVDNGGRQGRSAAAQLLVDRFYERPEARGAMLRALRRDDVAVVEAGCALLLNATDPDDLARLIDVLRRSESRHLAGALLNSGNPLLEDAACKWCKQRGVSIITMHQ